MKEKITVEKLITWLLKYNMEAEVSVIVYNKQHDFSISFGSSDGVTEKTAEKLFIDIDVLCVQEEPKRN
jgi:hypothetical protein